MATSNETMCLVDIEYASKYMMSAEDAVELAKIMSRVRLIGQDYVEVEGKHVNLRYFNDTSAPYATITVLPYGEIEKMELYTRARKEKKEV